MKSRKHVVTLDITGLNGNGALELQAEKYLETVAFSKAERVNVFLIGRENEE